jgi:excisionase family DNA binding protein
MEEEIKLRETLSVVQAAAALGLSNTSVYRLIYDQKVKVLKGFGRLRIPRTELDKLLTDLAVYTPKGRKKSVGQPVQCRLALKQEAAPVK